MEFEFELVDVELVELVEIVEEVVVVEVVEVEGDSSIGAALSLSGLTLSLWLRRRVEVVEVELNGLTRAMLDVPARAAVDVTVTLGTPARTGSDAEPAVARTGALDDEDDDDDDEDEDVLALPALPAVEGVELLNTE